MGNRFSTTIVAVALCAAVNAELSAQSQPKDSSATFSLFGGRVLNGTGSMPGMSLTDLEFGGSGDFRVSAVPVPLRLGVAFRQEDRPWALGPIKFGTLSLDLVGKPLPRFFGVQPYLLGGLGVGTRAEYLSLTSYLATDAPVEATSVRTIGRHTWTFAEGGVGVEFGRHLFVQTKLMVPVASPGPVFLPLSVGFRFWD
jgi:hypothetical protein